MADCQSKAIPAYLSEYLEYFRCRTFSRYIFFSIFSVIVYVLV